jgi:hypothetical protein
VHSHQNCCLCEQSKLAFFAREKTAVRAAACEDKHTIVFISMVHQDSKAVMVSCTIRTAALIAANRRNTHPNSNDFLTASRRCFTAAFCAESIRTTLSRGDSKLATAGGSFLASTGRGEKMFGPPASSASAFDASGLSCNASLFLERLLDLLGDGEAVGDFAYVTRRVSAFPSSKTNSQ